MNADNTSIEAIKLRKTFKVKNREGGLLTSGKYLQIEAVKDISFTIQKGDIVSFIGSNGAGKSTTTGILIPDSGSIRIGGLDFRKKRREIMMKVGVVFGQRSVNP